MPRTLPRVPVCPSGAGLYLAAWALGTAAVLTALADAPASAQRKTPPSSREAMFYSFAPVVKTAAPAVVNVYVSSRVKTFVSPFADDPVFGRLFAERFGMPQERMQNSLGSGVIVSADGVVVTNNHVIKGGGMTEIRIVLADKREFDAKVVLRDEKTDIAVLRITSGDGRFPFIELADSDSLEVGDMVLAIGNPFGVGQTVTQGIISALARSEVGQSEAQVFIQTDAAINPGNSGGALVDVSGRLAGINTSIYSRTGASHGIGFAIPSNLVRLYVDSALKGGKVERPWLGAKIEVITRDMAQALGLDRAAGALVARVSDKGPAAEAGMQAGDVIVAVDGFEVPDARSALYRLTTRGVGNRAKLDIVRKGRKLTVTVALAPAPKPGPNDLRDLSGAHPLDGLQVAAIVPSVADEFNLEEQDGVAIVKVQERSAAARVGFLPGDILVQVGRHRIITLADVDRAVKERQRQWQIAVKRGGRLLQVQVPGG